MNEKINLPELIALLSEKTGISKNEAEAFIKECFRSIEEGLVKNKAVEIEKLGTFSPNPTKGSKITDRVNFTPGKELSETVNEPFAYFPIEEVNNEELANEISQQENKTEGKKNEIREESMDIGEEKFRQYNFEAQGRRRRKKRIPIGYTLLIASLLIVLAGFAYIKFIKKDSPFHPKQETTTSVAVETEKQKPVTEEASAPLEPSNIVEESTPPQEQAPAEEKQAIRKRTVQPKERLTTIALEEYGNKQFWVYIYEENKAAIPNHDRIQIGLELIIPPASKYKIDANNPESVRKAKEIENRIKFR